MSKRIIILKGSPHEQGNSNVLAEQVAIGVLGYAITLFMFGLAKTFVMLLIARSFSGILSSATMPTAMAYIGDNTPQKERSKGMGQLGCRNQNPLPP